MTDREIVDRLVALGIVRRDGDQFFLGEVKLHGGWLHDWRVAGACLERMGDELFQAINMGGLFKVYWRDGAVRNQSYPRAIIEAYCEAMEGQ